MNPRNSKVIFSISLFLSLYLSLFLSLPLSISLSLPPSIYLSFSLRLILCIYLPFFLFSLNLSLSLYLSVCPSSSSLTISLFFYQSLSFPPPPLSLCLSHVPAEGPHSLESNKPMFKAWLATSVDSKWGPCQFQAL